jgi:hypothetical protein
MAAVGFALARAVMVRQANKSTFSNEDKMGVFMGRNAESVQEIKDTIDAMDVDNVAMGSGIASLISDPLNACVNAQAALNDSYIQNILELCDIVESEDQTGNDGLGTPPRVVPRVARMTIQTQDGDSTIEVPLLSLVQPAQLAVTQCRIDFTAEVTNALNLSEKSNTNGSSTAN